MTDLRIDRPDPFDADSRDRSGDSRLREALALAVDEGGLDGRVRDVAAPDAGRVAGHFAGVGDGDLLDAAARHDSIRRLLVDVSAMCHGPADVSESDAGPDVHSGGACSEAVRARAIAAFGAPPARSRNGSSGVSRAARVACEGPVGHVGSFDFAHSIDERRLTPTARWTRWAVAASIVLVPAVGLFIGGHRAEAAVLALDGFDRVDAAGAVETAGPRRLSMGDEVSSGAGERISLRLADGARVVLGDRSRMSIGCDAPCEGRCGGAVFELESGGITAAASDARGIAVPVALRVRTKGRVDVLSGAARVERSEAGATSLELRADARVRWSPDGGPVREFVGPASVHLEATGYLDAMGRSLSKGSPEAGVANDVSHREIRNGAFRDLDFFGEPIRRVEDTIRVGARRWRIRADEASGSADSAMPRPDVRGTRDDVGGVSVIRFDLEVDGTGRVAWPADAPVYAARRLEVRFRTKASSEASGEKPSESTILVRLDGVGGVERTVVVGVPGSVVFDLPAAFASTPVSLPELTLSWTAHGAGATIWFESAAFSFDPPDRAVAVMNPAFAGGK